MNSLFLNYFNLKKRFNHLNLGKKGIQGLQGEQGLSYRGERGSQGLQVCYY